MKRLFTLLLVSFVAMSCEMVDEKLDDLLGKKDVVVFAEGTELSVDVPSKQTVLNYKFESTLDWEVKTDAEWLEIDPMSGKAGKDIKIQIKVAKNKDKEGRTGHADLTLSNDESYRITINQAGEDDENDEGDENEGTIVDVPANQIWYTSVDGEVVEPYSGEYNEYAEATTTFGVNIVSNTYADGKGVIEFEGDVTIIGGYAFYGCSNLTSVTIPDSVTTIGYAAFYNCSSLTSVTTPDSVTTIGEWAFGYCKSLTSVTIPDSVTTIGGYAFYDCESLNAVHITDLVAWCNIDFINPITDGYMDFRANPLVCGKNLYLNGELLTDLIIPDSIKEVKVMTFNGCKSITSVTIPDGVTTIGNAAFYNCSSLTSVTIGDSVTTIGHLAFCNCNSLTGVTIPDSVTEIGTQAFCWCCSLMSINIPNSLKTTGGCVFGCCENLSEFNSQLASEDGRFLVIDGKLVAFAPAGLTEYSIPDSVTSIGSGAFAWCESLTSVTIPDSVTTIEEWAFRYCTSLTSVTIPDSVTTIGHHAFADCYSLTSVTIPDSVTTIGDYAFYNCSSLTSVTIGDSVTTIGFATFAFCENLKTVYCKAINPPTTIVNNNSYWYGFVMQDESGNLYDIDCTIYVPAESVEAYKSAEGWSEYADDIVGYDFETGEVDDTEEPELSEYVIEYTSTDGDIVVPYDIMAFDATIVSNVYKNGKGMLCFDREVTTIGEHAFYACYSLRSVTIPDSVTEIGYGAFAGCSSLTSVTIPDSVTTIGKDAFFYCYSLTSITIPDSVTTIGDFAFVECRNLTSVYITDLSAWCKIDFGYYSNPLYYAKNFYLNNELVTDLIIPSDITEIKSHAFGYCRSLTSVIIGDSVTTIGDYAFSNCTNLTSVTIPDSVTTIGEGAFLNCDSLNAVYITDLTSWCNIDFCTCIDGSVVVEGANPLFYAANLYLNGELVTDLVIPDGVTEIRIMLFAYCSSLISVTIPDSVTTIGDSAFQDCDSLTSVTIGDSVTAIGYFAFDRCSSLTSVYCKATTPPAGDSYMFSNNASGRKIYVPMESVEAYKSAQGWSDHADAIFGYEF